tara:strand:+ start:94 stop:1197 length:1104 start_codon:yes stop_codon:yes gene_type:complete
VSFIAHLEELEDSREDINKAYELIDIVFLTMAASLGGAEGWKAIKRFGDNKLDWLREFRPFENGIPTRHTIGRIIRGISADSLVHCFANWINSQRELNGQQQIAFDGKTLKGSGKNKHIEALHLMSAMVVESGLVIYQTESKNKKNEIKTMQSMLECIPVKGHIVTADAMHCQTETAKKIREEGADYVLQVKGNQKRLREEIAAYFHKVERDTPDAFDGQTIADIDGEHGRIIQREYRVLPQSDWMEGMDNWKGIQSVVEVKRTHIKESETTTEVSYHISSLAPDVHTISRAIRNHWSIENGQHWILDVVFREDESLIYAEDGAKNMALFKRVLLNLLKAHPAKDSIKGKKQMASWDDAFRAEVLFG